MFICFCHKLSKWNNDWIEAGKLRGKWSKKIGCSNFILTGLDLILDCFLMRLLVGWGFLLSLLLTFIKWITSSLEKNFCPVSKFVYDYKSKRNIISIRAAQWPDNCFYFSSFRFKLFFLLSKHGNDSHNYDVNH